MALRRKKENKNISDEALVDIVEVRDKTSDFFEENKGLVIGGLAAIALIIGGFLAYKFAYKIPREESAAEELYHAERLFMKDSFDLALENPGGGFNGLIGIIDEYSGTKSANLAKYYAGVSYLNLGRFEDAIEYMEDFSPAGDITPIMKHGVLGDAYSELGDFDKAVSSYKKAASSNNAFLTPYYANKLGMLLIKQGNPDEAKKYFAKIKDEFPSSNEAGTADFYLAK